MSGDDGRQLAAVGSGGQSSRASLRAGVVYREPGPWSQAVQALLRHLEDAGFAGAPRVVGGGFAPDGREMVSYIEGSSPHPHAWAEDAVGGIGALLAGWRSGRRTGMNELDDLAARLRDAGGLPDLLAVAHAAFGAIVLSSADVIGEPVRGMLVPRR